MRSTSSLIGHDALRGGNDCGAQALHDLRPVSYTHLCAEALNFLPAMEGGILSYKEHLIKPEPEIYQLLLKRYGLKAEESVFLDDTLKNVEAAEEQGIHGIHYCRSACKCNSG